MERKVLTLTLRQLSNMAASVSSNEEVVYICDDCCDDCEPMFWTTEERYFDKHMIEVHSMPDWRDDIIDDPPTLIIKAR